jgi:hypothetical protein
MASDRVYFLIQDISYTPKGDFFCFDYALHVVRFISTLFIEQLYVQAFIYYIFPPLQSLRRSAILWLILNARRS